MSGMRRRGDNTEPVPVRDTAIFQAVAQQAAVQGAEVMRLRALLVKHGIEDEVQLDREHELKRGEL